MTTDNKKLGTGSTRADLREKLAAAGYDPETEGVLARVVDVLEETGLSLSSAAVEMGFSSTTLSRLLSGKYGAGLDSSMGLVREFLRRHEAGRCVVQGRFVETDVWELVRSSMEHAQQFHRVVSLVGNSQIGKTCAVLEYRRRALEAGSDHVVYVRMPSMPTPYAVAAMICRELGLEGRRRLATMREGLAARLGPRHVLVVDEVHQVALATGDNGLRVVEMLRELYDLTRCGMVLVGTNVWSRVLVGKERRDWRGYLEQLVKRGIAVEVPAVPSHRDQRAVWEAYGLPEPDAKVLAVVRGIVAEWGMGRFVERLQAAATTAQAAGKEFAWVHFLAVHGQLEKLAGGVERY